jgi:hypothetical protein
MTEEHSEKHEEHKHVEHHEHAEHGEHEAHKHMYMEHHQHQKHKGYMIATWILAGVSILLLIGLILALTLSGGGSKGLSADKLKSQMEAYFQTDTGKTITGGAEVIIDEVKDTGSIYTVKLSVAGKQFDSYVTKDGKLLFPQGGIDMTQVLPPTAAPAEIPKNDKPVADFFVFSYCPYGTQIEKALVPAYNLLKNKADINIVFIGAMHGDFEKVESYRQLCIQKEYGKDKLFAYLDKFLVNAAIGSCQGTDTCVNPLIEAIYTPLGIDKTKINSCMAADAEALYTANEQQAAKLGISSSPSVTINGVQSDVGRSPALVQQAICAGFTTAPAECNQTLSSTAASAGFGSTASSGSTASCG